mgnify:CR=1 FL=1
MQTITRDQLIEKAVSLLADGTVSCVLGWKKGEFDYDITPAVFTTEEEINNAKNIIFRGGCVKIFESILKGEEVTTTSHNRGTEYAYFARLNELEKGDKIIYKTKFYERTYIVTKKKVIYDTDWSDLQTTKDNRITMITCIANKPNQRLCVQAVEEK